MYYTPTQDMVPQTTNQTVHTTPSLVYDGQLGHITRLWLVNLALFFVTLSFYRFWGRTRVRQYVWSHFSILGDRLEYTGTGKELCIGFLITVPIYILIAVISEFLSSGPSLFLILMVGYFAVYSGLRYRVTRTSWRAIRGRMPIEGSNPYSMVCLKRAGINILTLGFAIPTSDLLKWQSLVENIHIGNARVRFRFDTHGLMLPHAISSLLGIAALALPVTFAIGLGESIAAKDAGLGVEDKANIVGGIVTLGMVVGWPFFFMIRQWYTAKLVQKKFAGLWIEGAQIKTHFSIGQFMGFKITNMLIFILTLGLGSAFILHRKARFFARFVSVEGSPDANLMVQSAAEKNKLTEGLIDTFGVDLSFLS